MTEKRFKNRLNKSNTKFNALNPVWDNKKETALNVFEMMEEMNRLNDENEQLKEINQELQFENSKHVGNGEWDIKDITCMHGKFRLEEWGERYHQFYNGDIKLEDEEVVSLLFENENIIKEVLELLEEVDLFTDKATEHNITAYNELKGFDNKDAYCMAVATKKAIKLLNGVN